MMRLGEWKSNLAAVILEFCWMIVAGLWHLGQSGGKKRKRRCEWVSLVCSIPRRLIVISCRRYIAVNFWEFSGTFDWSVNSVNRGTTSR